MSVRSSIKQYRAVDDSIRILLWLTLVAVISWSVAAVLNHSIQYWYLIWNLFLAWLPLIFASLIFYKVLPKYGNRNWRVGILSLAWLIFLPNSFYIITDLIHLQDVSRYNIMLDIVMFILFVLAGLAVGFVSLIIMHRTMKLNLSQLKTIILLIVIFLLCGFALYLGREMRWNSWDIIADPFGLIFTVSDVIIHPRAHADAFGLTILFASFLSTVYVFVWRLGRLISKF